jgi:hypothetical protein
MNNLKVHLHWQILQYCCQIRQRQSHFRLWEGLKMYYLTYVKRQGTDETTATVPFTRGFIDDNLPV